MPQVDSEAIARTMKEAHPFEASTVKARVYPYENQEGVDAAYLQWARQCQALADTLADSSQRASFLDACGLS
jgi:hypothetical protein